MNINSLNIPAVEKEQLANIFSNPQPPLEDRIACTYLEQKLNLADKVEESINELEQAAEKADRIFRQGKYFNPFSYDADEGLAVVVAKAQQLYKLSQIGERLEQICPTLLNQNNQGKPFPQFDESHIPARVTQDLREISNIENAQTKEERKIAIENALRKGIPLNFLQSIFRRGIYTDTSSLDENALMEISSMLNKIERKSHKEEAFELLPKRQKKDTVIVDTLPSPDHKQRKIIDLTEEITEPQTETTQEERCRNVACIIVCILPQIFETIRQLVVSLLVTAFLGGRSIRRL